MGAIPGYIKTILSLLRENGHKGWCVGGCVRDLLRGMDPHDYDVATTAIPQEVMEIFGDCAVPTGLQHGTVSVKWEGQWVEITTLRRDGVYLDGRHPSEVTFTDSLEEDLARRDFTVNAMAMGEDEEVIDPYGGRQDLAERVLRCVGEADRRLQEDALRIMRALRFASVLSFTVEEETARALRKNSVLLEQIAVERVTAELTKLLCGENVMEVLLNYSDVLSVVLPEIKAAVGFDQHNKHHCYDVWEHSVRALAAAPSDPILRYTMLFHDKGKPETFSLDEEGVGHFYNHGRASAAIAENACRRLRLDNESREAIVLLVRIHDIEIVMTEKGIKRMLCRIGEENLRRLLIVKRCDNLAQHPRYLGRQQWISDLEDMLELVLQQELCFSLKQLAVKGNDLIAIGLSGREIGEMLDHLLDLVVEEKLPNDRLVLLEYAKEARK